MSWTLTTSGACVLKAGTHANSTIAASGAALLKWSDDAEGYIEATTRKKWVDGYSGLDTGIKGILSDIVSSKVAMAIIAYDTTGYLTREADTLMNFNDDIITKGLGVLKDFDANSLKTL
jgi:hypothetical protein